MTHITRIRPATRFLAAILSTTLTMASQTALAQGTSLAGAWKIDPAKSNFSAGSASLSIARNESALGKAPGAFLVVSDDGNVYLATGADMHEATATGIKLTDYGRAQTSKMVLVGTNARRDDVCSFRCQSGLMERNLTLRFNSVGSAEHLMGEMLAYKTAKQ
jgi:hypothetical protein